MHNFTMSASFRPVIDRAPFFAKLACVAAISVLGLPASAAVFNWNALNRSTTSGFTVIPVCIVSGSSTNQSWWFNSPPLEDTITRIRWALRNSWERTSVRFTDWRSCDALTQNERSNAVGLYIHTDADNNALIGAKGHTTATDPTVQFKPWGYSCANYDPWTVTMVYTYECVQQYAIHEFGHVLGFEHEWRHPLRPSSCTGRPGGESVLPQWQISDTPRPDKFFVPNKTSYDLDSIMTYDTGCADVTGVRFGSPVPDAVDLSAAMTVFSPGAANTVLDEQHYLAIHRDVSQAYGQSALLRAAQHWFENGIREGRVSSTQFDVRYYVGKYPDLQQAFGSDYQALVDHWLRRGISEARQASVFFDVQYYLATYSDLRQAFGNDYQAAMQHWVSFGLNEGRRGSAQFDARYYLQAYPDVARVYGAQNYRGAMEHYTLYGMREGRRGAP